MKVDLDKILVSREDVKRASEFSLRTWKKHKAHGRSEQQIRFDVFIGKLGEFAYKNIYEDKISEVYLDEENDPGYDFLFNDCPDYKVDIKTLKKKHFYKVFFNPNNHRCTHYGLMRIVSKNKDDSIVLKFEGHCIKREVLQRSIRTTYPDNSESYYVDSKYFKR